MKQEKFIEVYDDIIPKPLSDLIEHQILNQVEYKYLKNITNNELPGYHPGFLSVFFDITTSFLKPYSFNLFQILYKLCSAKNISLEYIFTGRAFLHVPSPSPLPDNIHVDLPNPHWVCLYYVTDSDGDTILYEDDEKTEIQRITPKKGRIAFFDGSIKHCSSSPSKTHRAIINFDFIGEYLDKQK